MVIAIYSDCILRVGSFCRPLSNPIFYHRSIVLMPPPLLSCLLCTFIYAYRGGVFGQRMSNVFSIIERLNVLLPLFVFYYLRLRRGVGIIREIVNLLYTFFQLTLQNFVLCFAILVKVNLYLF